MEVGSERGQLKISLIQKLHQATSLSITFSSRKRKDLDNLFVN